MTDPRCIFRLDDPGYINRPVAIARDGNLLVFARVGGLSCITLGGKKMWNRKLRGVEPCSIVDIEFVPNGSKIVCFLECGKTFLIDSSDGQILGIKFKHPSVDHFLHYGTVSPCGNMFAIGVRDKTTRKWKVVLVDLNDLHTIWELDEFPDDIIYSITFNSKSEFILIRTGNVCQLFKVDTKELIWTRHEFDGTGRIMNTPNPRFFVYGKKDGTVPGVIDIYQSNEQVDFKGSSVFIVSRCMNHDNHLSILEMKVTKEKKLDVKNHGCPHPLRNDFFDMYNTSIARDGTFSIYADRWGIFRLDLAI